MECASGGTGDGAECEIAQRKIAEHARAKALPYGAYPNPYLSLSSWTRHCITRRAWQTVGLHARLQQRNDRPQDGRSWGMGAKWESSRLAFVRSDSGLPYQATLFAPQGGQRNYTTDGTTTHTRSLHHVTEFLGYFRMFGRRPGHVQFGFAQPFYDGVTRYYQSSRTDRRGRTTQFNYSLYNGLTARLTAIIDPDNRSTTLTYSTTYPERLVGIDDPYGRKVEFSYNASGQLSAIEDVQGITSHFTYDIDGRISTTLVTPYGTTTSPGRPMFP